MHRSAEADHSSFVSASPALERYPEQGGPAEHVVIQKLPFTIGRADHVDYKVYSNRISKEHAAIVMIDGRYAIRDLKSTNGTFVNSVRTSEAYLRAGDIIHLAHVEFCFRPQMIRPPSATTSTCPQETHSMLAIPTDSLIRGSRALRELIDTKAVDIVFQPIVDLGTRAVVAYEALGRGRHPELSRQPCHLLRLAEQCGMEVELSRLLSTTAVARSLGLPRGTRLFINVHASELASANLHKSFLALRQAAPEDRPLVVEISEAAVIDTGAMEAHKAMWASLDIEFAYDDFGAGQTRLRELSDTPPHFLKLDRGLIHNIHLARSRQEMVEALVRFVRAMGVRVIAEGIESEETAAICRDLGCELGQGYHFGRPE